VAAKLSGEEMMRPTKPKMRTTVKVEVSTTVKVELSTTAMKMVMEVVTKMEIPKSPVRVVPRDGLVSLRECTSFEEWRSKNTSVQLLPYPAYQILITVAFQLSFSE
jgi:citrate lyase gamma subunit